MLLLFTRVAYSYCLALVFNLYSFSSPRDYRKLLEQWQFSGREYNKWWVVGRADAYHSTLIGNGKQLFWFTAGDIWLFEQYVLGDYT